MKKTDEKEQKKLKLKKPKTAQDERNENPKEKSRISRKQAIRSYTKQEDKQR